MKIPLKEVVKAAHKISVSVEFWGNGIKTEATSVPDNRIHTQKGYVDIIIVNVGYRELYFNANEIIELEDTGSAKINGYASLQDFDTPFPTEPIRCALFFDVLIPLTGSYIFNKNFLNCN